MVGVRCDMIYISISYAMIDIDIGHEIYKARLHGRSSERGTMVDC